MLKNFIIVFLLLLSCSIAVCQHANQPVCVGFYNLENFFDTIDDPKTRDDDFLPNSEYHYNTAVYKEKLDHISEVISLLGKDACSDGAALLGVSEVENYRVLRDLVSQPRLDSFHFKFVHYDSPDPRGIDVALLYNPSHFKVIHSEARFVRLFNPGQAPHYTRDVLWVYGTLDGEPVHVLVNHWPSRLGGAEASEDYRCAAARVCKRLIDSLENTDKNAKIILMGDLNDDPVDSSVSKVLNAGGASEFSSPHGLYNPSLAIFKKGGGTLEYNDHWNLFDQIIFTPSFLGKTPGKLHFSEARIFNRDFLIIHSGRYKGYPHRTYIGKYWIHGYSDHFPVYAVLQK